MLSFLTKRKKLVLLLFLIFILGILFYKKLPLFKKREKTESVKVKPVNAEETLTISGKIEAEEHVTLRFQTIGRLSWIRVKEGDLVRKYQAIASLDQREVKKNLEKYLNDFLKKRWDFDQTLDDNKNLQYDLSKAVRDKAKRAMEKAQFDLNNAILDVEIKNLAVELSTLITPIEGLVVNVGSPYAGINISSPTQAEFEIINPKTVYFQAIADQTEVTQLKEEMTGKLSLDSYPEKTLTGKIKKISFVPKSDETGTAYAIKFVFDDSNNNYQYRLGMTGDLTFVITEKKND